MTKIPFSPAFSSLPSPSTTAASMPGERDAARAGLDRQQRDAVRIADDRSAGLGLPVVIDDRDAVAERLLLEPLPGGRVEHLAGAEDALERAEVVLLAPARCRSA